MVQIIKYSKSRILCFSFMISSFVYSTDILKGIVLDINEKPIEDANVEVLNTSYGTTTNSDGSFFIDNLDNDYYSIKITHIGYEDFVKDYKVDNSDYHKIYMSKKIIDLNRIVVTGTRYQSHIKDTPVLTHVVGKQDIYNSLYTNVKDVMQEVLPNIQSVPSNHTGDRVKFQGLDNKYMLFLIDGEKVVGEFAGNLDLSMLNLSNIEKIEIISNSMSVIYGSDAISGVVNVIPVKRTDKNWFHYSKSIDKLLYETNNYTVGFNKNKVMYELSYVFNSSDGFDLAYDPQAPYDYTIKAFENKSIQNRIAYSINPLSTLEFLYKKFQSSIYDFKSASGTDDKTLFEQQNKFKDNVYKLRYKNNISKRSSVSVSVYNENYTKYYYFPFYYNEEGNDVDINGEKFEQGNLNHNNLYFQFNTILGVHNLLFGAERTFDYYSSYNVYANENDDVPAISSIFNSIDTRKKYYQTSFFVHNHIKYSKDNEISVGLRGTKGINFKDKIIISLSHMIKDIDGYNIRTTFSSGYRFPSIKELYYDFQDHTPPVMGNPNLVPSTSKNYSISFDKRTKENDFAVDFSINDIDNFISSKYIENYPYNQSIGQCLFYENYDNVLLSRVNIHYSRNLNNDSSVKFVYNYTDIDNDSEDIMELVSKHALRVNYKYKIYSQLLMMLNVRYVGEKFNFSQEIDFSNQLIEYGQEEQSAITFLKPYWITDLLFASQSNRLFYYKFGVRNIFDYKSPDRNDGSNILNTYEPHRRLVFEVGYNYKEI